MPLFVITTINAIKNQVKMTKKVTFSTIVKGVSHQGEIRYQHDPRINRPGENLAGPIDNEFQEHGFENMDFIQHHIEELFPFGGDTYEDHVNMLSVPFFQCTRAPFGATSPALDGNNGETKIGALDYLKAFAQKSQAGSNAPIATEKNALAVALLSEVTRRRDNQKKEANSKRGIIQPKDIPGRDTPEQRKLRLMESKYQSLAKAFEKASSPMSHSSKPKSILKLSKNEYYSSADGARGLKLAESTSHDSRDEEDETSSSEQSQTNNYLWNDKSSKMLEGREEREQPEEINVPAEIYTPQQHEITRGSRDPPSADELMGNHKEHKQPPATKRADFRPRVTRHEYRPDPSALYTSEDMYRPGSMPSMESTRPVVTTRRPSRRRVITE